MLVQFHLEARCDNQTKSEPDRGSDRPNIQTLPNQFSNILPLFLVESLAGRYRDPVLILPLIIDEHTGLNHCSLLARVDTPDFVVIMAFCALAVKLSYSQQGVY